MKFWFGLRVLCELRELFVFGEVYVILGLLEGGCVLSGCICFDDLLVEVVVDYVVDFVMVVCVDCSFDCLFVVVGYVG